MITRYSTDQLENMLLDILQAPGRPEIQPCSVSEFVSICMKEGVERGRVCFSVMGLDYGLEDEEAGS